MVKLYDKDLKRFFESARFRVSGTKSPGGGLLVAGSTQELANKKKSNQAGLLGKRHSLILLIYQNCENSIVIVF